MNVFSKQWQQKILMAQRELYSSKCWYLKHSFIMTVNNTIVSFESFNDFDGKKDRILYCL
jgi:hypothetical protein